MAEAANQGGAPAAGGVRNPVQEKTREYLLGLEDKRFMDEIVAVYLRVSGNPSLEAKFRETLDVSLPRLNSTPFASDFHNMLILSRSKRKTRAHNT